MGLPDRMRQTAGSGPHYGDMSYSARGRSPVPMHFSRGNPHDITRPNFFRDPS